jgi:zinc protease
MNRLRRRVICRCRFSRNSATTQDQLTSAKNCIKGQYPPSIETSSQLARLIARNEFYGLDDSEVNELAARIDAVTPQIARQIIQKHFPEENLVFVLIGKASAIGPAAKKYSEKQDTRPVSEPDFWPQK